MSIVVNFDPSDSPEGKSADAKSTASKTSISVKLPTAQSAEEQRKKAGSPGVSLRKFPAHLQVGR